MVWEVDSYGSVGDNVLIAKVRGRAKISTQKQREWQLTFTQQLPIKLSRQSHRNMTPSAGGHVASHRTPTPAARHTHAASIGTLSSPRTNSSQRQLLSTEKKREIKEQETRRLGEISTHLQPFFTPYFSHDAGQEVCTVERRQ